MHSVHQILHYCCYLSYFIAVVLLTARNLFRFGGAGDESGSAEKVDRSCSIPNRIAAQTK